jgi:hypothetical protein
MGVTGRSVPEKRKDSRIRDNANSYREAVSLCAEHVRQLGGESPPCNLMEVKD